MNEIDILISHTADLKEKCADESIITFTNFLSPEQRSEISKLEKTNNRFANTVYYGGYDEAERTTALFIPSFYEIKNSDIACFLKENGCEYISLLKVTKDKFATASHRDYLGALMGLGLKREMIGDIVTNENGCYIFCLKSVSSFIKENLKQAGRAQLNVEISPCDEFALTESKKENVFLSVASLRLDCMVAAAFSLSRSNAVTFIEKGAVFINGIQSLKTDLILKEGDKLVLRSKGKAVFDKVIGESKKGRIHINIIKYI